MRSDNVYTRKFIGLRTKYRGHIGWEKNYVGTIIGARVHFWHVSLPVRSHGCGSGHGISIDSDTIGITTLAGHGRWWSRHRGMCVCARMRARAQEDRALEDMTAMATGMAAGTVTGDRPHIGVPYHAVSCRAA
jgi:hypothetical protein